MWILILTLITPRGAALLNVPDFATEGYCHEAAIKWVADNNDDLYHTNAICVKQKRIKS